MFVVCLDDSGIHHSLGSKVLQNLSRVIRQPRALAAHQRHMPAVIPALEAINNVSQPRTPLREIRRIDLRDIPQAHHFRARPRPRDQRLHLLRRQILRFIDDQELVDEGPATHEVERLDLYP
jgi:hypothetical protein